MTIAGRSSPGGPVDDITLQGGHWPYRPGPDRPGRQSAGQQPARASRSGRARHRDRRAWAADADGRGRRQFGHRHRRRVGDPGRDRRRCGPAARRRAPRCCTGSPDPAPPPTSAPASRRSPRHCRRARWPPPRHTCPCRVQETSGIAPLAPFIITFGIIGLIMSVVIVTNVVSGAVVAGYRRIGILKSIGFTPGQVISRLLGAGAAARGGRLPGGPGRWQPAVGRAARKGRERVPGRHAGRAGLGQYWRARRDARPGRAGRAGARDQGRAAECGSGHRRGPGAAAGPGLSGAPGTRQAAAAAGRDHRPGRAVRPARARRRHRDGDPARRHHCHLRRRRRRLARPRVQEGLSLSQTEQAFVYVPQPGPGLAACG